MKKITVLFLLILSILALVSCGEAEAPEGMQLVYGSEEDGYYFYSPEGWNISNLEGVKAAYVSKVNTTSVSFTQVEVEAPDGISAEEYFFTSYFYDNFSEFPKGTDVTVKGEKTTFGVEGGKADRAIKYVYNYEYDGHRFGFIQTLMTKHGRFYICTYRATFDMYNDEVTYYEKYTEKYLMVENNFKFTEKLGASEDKKKTEYTKDRDGYILISDSELSGFDLYVPESFKVDYSSAAVKASHADGSNIMMTETAATNLSIDMYWKQRKEELSGIVTNLTAIKEIPTERIAEGEEGYEEYQKQLAESKIYNFGNADAAFACEYTYTYNGNTYHVYQVFAIDSTFMGSGYTFTFTAREENYEKHIESITKMLEKVKF